MNTTDHSSDTKPYGMAVRILAVVALAGVLAACAGVPAGEGDYVRIINDTCGGSLNSIDRPTYCDRF